MEVHSVNHQANYVSYSISQVMCQFTLGVKNSFKHHFSFNKINPNSGYGFPKMYSHEQINAKEVLFNISSNFLINTYRKVLDDGGVLDIRAIITFKGKVGEILKIVYCQASGL